MVGAVMNSRREIDCGDWSGGDWSDDDDDDVVVEVEVVVVDGLGVLGSHTGCTIISVSVVGCEDWGD